MKIKTSLIPPLMVGVLLPCLASGVLAAGANELKLGKGISVLTNPEMSKLRGKYVVSDNQVLYFGVEMASVWKTPDGQQLQGQANLALDFTTAGKPLVSFTPTVSIVSGPATGASVDTSNRQVSSSAVDNVAGLGQSIQVAGDYNDASNTLTVRVVDKVPDINRTPDGKQRDAVTNGDASASSELNDAGATVLLTVAGQGVVRQSIRGAISGNTGQGAYQTIKILGDSHRIANRMQLSIMMKPETESSNLGKTLGVSLGVLRGL